MRIPSQYLNTEPLATGLGRPTRTEPKPAPAPHACEWKPAHTAGYVRCTGCGSVTLATMAPRPQPVVAPSIEDGDVLDWYGLDFQTVNTVTQARLRELAEGARKEMEAACGIDLAAPGKDRTAMSVFNATVSKLKKPWWQRHPPLTPKDQALVDAAYGKMLAAFK